MKIHHHRTQTGFTLLELIVVISVISIMGLLAIPHFKTMKDRFQLSGATRKIMQELTSARMRAVSRHCNIRIKILDDHNYRIWTDRNRNNVIDTGEEVSRDIRNDYPGVSLYRFVTLDTIVFNPKGAADQFFLLGLKNAGGWKNISTNITGRIKII